MSGGQLSIRAERRDRICVIAVSGSLDLDGSNRLAERAKAERVARLVIDMSGVSSVDVNGARALTALASPLPGRCPVVVRSVRPAVRRQLELTGLNLGQPDSGRPDGDADPAEAPPRGRGRVLADSATASLIRERRHLLGLAERAIADSYQTAQSLASTEDQIATTLLMLAARRPAASARLAALSQTARSYATTLRDRRRHDAAPATAASSHRSYAASGTVGRAVAFIEERARDDIGVADIAAAAFVTVRAVQLAFRRYLGTTPLGYLRRVRLERAHHQLLSADPDRTTVTAVAADWHFANPSRFSGLLPRRLRRSARPDPASASRGQLSTRTAEHAAIRRAGCAGDTGRKPRGRPR